jgi:protein-tyrosine phosphatase
MHTDLPSPRSPRVKSPRTMNSPRTSPRAKPLPHMHIGCSKHENSLHKQHHNHNNHHQNESTEDTTEDCSTCGSSVTISNGTDTASPNSAITITPLPITKHSNVFWEVEDDISEISHSLYLGNYKCSLDRNELLQYGITHIVQAVEVDKNPHSDTFEYYNVLVRDVIEEDLTEYFETVSDWIHEIVTRDDHSINKVFVHCGAGISRSAALVIAYLMKYEPRFKYSFRSAYDYCKTKRIQVKPNKGFKQQLQSYETKLRLGSELQIQFYNTLK